MTVSTEEYQLKCPICNNYETPLRSDFNSSIEKLDDEKFKFNVTNRMLWHLGKEHSKDKEELIKTIVYLLVELKTVREEMPRKHECKLSTKMLGLDNLLDK